MHSLERYGIVELPAGAVQRVEHGRENGGDGMFDMTVGRAAAACGGKLLNAAEPEAALSRVIIDSRQAQPGDLFAAYEGERVDGHDYMAAAFAGGAACCLARRLPEGVTGPVILVPDVQEALEAILRDFRQNVHIPVIGITGSVGKTSAKEMCAAVLGSRLSVLKTEGNLNNQIGVPLTLSRLQPWHQAAVVEMGISGFGEMSRLALMARPDIALYTVIGHAHLEFLHDLDGVLKAKTEMLDLMSEDALVLVNGDDPKLKKLSCRQRLLRFGLGEDCELRAENIRLTGSRETACELVYGDRRVPVRIPAFGRHMVYAALGGAAVGLALGLTDGEIARGVAAYETVGRRGLVQDTGFLTLVDDSYNANPDSMRSSLASLADLPGRKVCILGDMLEMGPEAGQMHRELGEEAVRAGASLVLSCGPLAAEISRGAGALGRHFDSREALIAALPELICPGDAVLVKASRGMKFEEIAEALKLLK